MKVKDILARKGGKIRTIDPAGTVEAVAELMRVNRVGAIVVSGNGERIDGFVTERDLVYSLAIHKGELHRMPVSAIMTTDVITCSPSDSAVSVAGTMHARGVRHIPVADNGRVVGMISIRDVLNLRVDGLQQEAAMLRSYAAQSTTEQQDR